MHLLPGKKVLVVFVVSIGLIVWITFDTLRGESSVLKNSVVVQALSGAADYFTDTDEDGLSDWEERLFGTNINDPDSNNNGLSDGMELDAKKKIPVVGVPDSPLNYLSQIGQAAANSGNVQLPEPQLVLEQDIYGRSSLTIIEASNEDRNAYMLKVLETLVLDYPDVVDTTALTLIQNWLETGDATELDNIKKYVTSLERLAADLSLIAVPKDAVNVHLALTNSIYKEAQSLKEIEVTNFNPGQGFLAAAKYANYHGEYTAAIVALTDYYNNAIR